MSEDYDFDDVPAETPLSAEEAIIRRHRREKKELQGKILSMKKCVNKSDKKRKKELEAEILVLESDLNAKHKLELDTFQPKRIDLPSENPPVPEVSNLSLESQENSGSKPLAISDQKLVESGAELLSSSPGTPKLSRAQKRRDKKSCQQREIQKRIDLETEDLVENSLWKKEDKEFDIILKNLGLDVFDIPSDGDCLYSAVSHQLDHHGQDTHSATSLRRKTATYLQDHKADFIPFMDETVTGSDEAFATYCNDIATTTVWGGQLEVQVLSKFLKLPIRVIQTDSPPLVFGEDFKGPILTLTYHRHKIQAGEHYNSAVPPPVASSDDA